MNTLESLLKELLAHELNARRGKGTVKRLDEIKQICHSMYTNPDNWLATRTIALLHVETNETLGVFQEYQHKKTSARKLERIVSNDVAVQADTEERVSGQQWVQPFVHRVDPPTEGELAHIRAKWLPKMWRPAWKHKQAKIRTAKEMLEELHASA